MTGGGDKAARRRRCGVSLILRPYSSSPLLRAADGQASTTGKMVTGSGLCAKVVVVDARHHMLGRLASILAKELLNGQRVVRFFSSSPLPPPTSFSSSSSSSSSLFSLSCFAMLFRSRSNFL
jgi:hypothetical protein